MKKRVNYMLMLIAASAILLTTVLLTLVYYNLFREQVMKDLRTNALLLAQEFSLDNTEEMIADGLTEELRVTCIDSDGTVLYDSVQSPQDMDNHGGRPEVSEALAAGEGRDARISSTFAENTFYYALRMQDGSVLRVAREADSIYQMFIGVLPGVLTVLAVVLLGCLLVSRLLTGKLIRPLQRLAANLDAYEEEEAYEELTPFVRMIKEQHQDIIKGARIRQDFTANVTHELKTPLTSISGYAELLETGMASEKEVQRFARGIHKSANRLLNLINDIIKLSELDSSEQEFVTEQVDMYELAQTCVEMLQPNAEKHQVTLEFEKGEQRKCCTVKGNKQMLEELLYNLCDNAIRYNNPGGNVWVQVAAREEQIMLKVKDNGIGIPFEHQDRIFERFYRVDKSRSKQTGGTGLGLAIVKHIIARHHASLELDSEVGVGTEIRVWF